MLAEKSKPKTQPQTTAQATTWKVVVSASNKLYSYAHQNPELSAAIQNFVANKFKFMRNAVQGNMPVTSQTLSLGKTVERGRLNNPRIKQYDHIHMNLAGGKLYVLFYWQQIDPASKTLSLKLGTIVDHKQYDSKGLENALAKSLSGADYVPVGVIESKKLFDWLGPRPVRKLFDWIKDDE